MFDLISDLVLISFPDHLIEPINGIDDIVAASPPCSLLLNCHANNCIHTHVEVVCQQNLVVESLALRIIDLTFDCAAPKRELDGLSLDYVTHES